MASFNRVVFSGSTNVINVPFPYLDKTHVQVTVGGTLLASTAYTWPTDSQIVLTAGNPAAGTIGVAQRVTPSAALVTFSPGNLDDSDLNVASLQPLYLGEEARDNSTDALTRAWVTSALQTGGLITKGSDQQTAIFDASGNIIPGPDAGDIADAEANAAVATAAAGAASSSATLAQAWASNPEDVVVTGGLFSAFHWYRKTLALYNSVVAGFAGAIHGSPQKSAVVDADEFGITDSGASFALKRSTLGNIVASIFTATRKIASAAFQDDVTFYSAAGLTKGMKFLLSGVTAGATRVVRVPDLDTSTSLWEPISVDTVVAQTTYTKTGLDAFEKIQVILLAGHTATPDRMFFSLSPDNGATLISAAASHVYEVQQAIGSTASANTTSSTTYELTAGSNALVTSSYKAISMVMTILGGFNKLTGVNFHADTWFQTTSTAVLNALTNRGVIQKSVACNAYRLSSASAWSGTVVTLGIRG